MNPDTTQFKTNLSLFPICVLGNIFFLFSMFNNYDTVYLNLTVHVTLVYLLPKLNSPHQKVFSEVFTTAWLPQKEDTEVNLNCLQIISTNWHTNQCFARRGHCHRSTSTWTELKQGSTFRAHQSASLYMRSPPDKMHVKHVNIQNSPTLTDTQVLLTFPSSLKYHSAPVCHRRQVQCPLSQTRST